MRKGMTKHKFDMIGTLSYSSFFWVIATTLEYAKAILSNVKEEPNSIAENARMNRDRASSIIGADGFMFILMRIYKKEFFDILILNMIYLGSQLTNISFMIDLTNLLDPNSTDSNLDLKEAPLYMGLVLLTQFLKTFSLTHMMLYKERVGFRIRSGVTAIVYKKLLLSSLNSYSLNTPGKIASLIQVDMENISSFIRTIDLGIQGFGSLIAICIIYAFTLGWGQVIIYIALIGVSLLVGVLGSVKKHYFTGYMQRKDERLQLLKSIISSVKMVKIKTLELFYNYKVTIKRKLELSRLRGVFITSAFMLCMPMFATISTPTIVFFVIRRYFYDSVGRQGLLVFLMYFDVFLLGYNNISDFIINTADCLVSFNRINEFLNCEEKQESLKETLESDIAFSIQNGEFFWGNREDELQNPNNENDLSIIVTSESKDTGRFNLMIEDLKIKKGQFVVVLGKNGSGKSTFVYSLLKESCHNKEAQVHVAGRVSFLSQTPWVFTDTIRENIIFGDEFNQERFIRALKLSQFWEDVNEMEKGVDTYCEENGANLSGGQRARLALARCFYHNSELMILDDPLKALDAKVTRYVLEGSISTFFKEKTRIMTTNIPSHAKYADRVIILEKGYIAYDGDLAGALSHKIFEGVSLERERSEPIDMNFYQVGAEDNFDKKKDELEPEEHIEIGRVSAKVIYNALREYGSFWGLPLSFIFAGISFFLYIQYLMNNYRILDEYGQSSFKSDLLNNLEIGLLCIFTLFIGILLVLLLGLNLSKNLHFKMLFSILHAKVAEYLDIMPSGIIMNRFTNDLDFVDRLLPMQLFTLIFPLFGAGFAMYTYIYATDMNMYFIALLILFVIIVLFSQNYFLKANNNMIRLLNSSKSPIVQLATGIAAGIIEVRAMGKEKYIEHQYLSHINNNIKYSTIVVGLKAGYSFYISIINYVLLTIPGFTYIYFNISSGSQSAMKLDVISNFLKNINEIGSSFISLVVLYNGLESLFVNLERCKEFEDLDPETGYIDIENTKKIHQSATLATIRENYRQYKGTFIQQGEITMKNYTAIYPNRVNPILKNLNLTIHAGEKVAVVGRTGSGKSTLAKVLWRALVGSGGEILIDEHNIDNADLSLQRSEMSIVSQDISIIDGTLRDNLDPFWNYDVTI